MASIKYGCLNPIAKTVEYPVAASQYFRHEGGSFVHLDSSGHVTLSLTATATLFGFAIPPTGRGAGASDAYWLSSATAGTDKIPVVMALEGENFLVPADDTATAAMAGNACDLIGVNDGTAQTADVGTSTTDVLLIQKAGTYHASGSTTDVIVKINPAKVQADT